MNTLEKCDFLKPIILFKSFNSLYNAKIQNLAALKLHEYDIAVYHHTRAPDKKE